MGPASLPTPLLPARGRSWYCRPSGGPSGLLHRLRAWRPVSRQRPAAPCHRFPCGPRTSVPPCFAVRHRRSRRHPTVLRGRSGRDWRKPLLRVEKPLVTAETAIRDAGGSSTVVPGPKTLSYSYRQLESRPFPMTLFAHCPQTSRLALGRNLLHVVSQTECGQAPPHLRFINALEFKALRPFFLSLRSPKTT